QKVEIERAVFLGVQGEESSAALRVHARVESLEVGGLPRERRPIVDQLDGDLAVLKVDLRHGVLHVPLVTCRAAHFIPSRRAKKGTLSDGATARSGRGRSGATRPPRWRPAP